MLKKTKLPLKVTPVGMAYVYIIQYAENHSADKFRYTDAMKYLLRNVSVNYLYPFSRRSDFRIEFFVTFLLN